MPLHTTSRNYINLLSSPLHIANKLILVIQAPNAVDGLSYVCITHVTL